MSGDIHPFAIVGIGASAGGVQALEEFFAKIPGDANVAFVVVTHLSPDRESMLYQIIGRHTVLPVEVAVDGAAVRPNHVYVLGANAVLGIKSGRLSVRSPSNRSERNLIDVFFSALALDRGEGAVGVVLSGGGSDGTLGIKAIKERGGVTFAQVADGTKPLFPEMPSSAIATGLVDYMLPVDEMAAKILDYTRAYVSLDASIDRDPADVHPMEDADAALSDRRQEIYAILRNQIGHDFSGYKIKTFLRRVQRRMRVLQIQTLEVYIDRLRQDGEEVGNLFRDLLINVTNFFRDAEAFEVLKATVIPKLFDNRGADDTVRIWVPGCSTGEEVFSVAMLMREHMDTLRAVPRVQIFATDIDAPALAVARAARYPEGLLDTVSLERRRRFFIADGSSFLVAKEVRDMCIFSPHSLIRDPPFSRIDLVSCRNLLIYFGPDIQGQVIPTFHYALRPGGFLFLGTSENISQYGELFTTADKKNRIFQARDNGVSALGLTSRMARFVNGIRPAPFTQDRRANRRSLSGGGGTGPGAPLRQRVETYVIDHHAPAHVVVTHEGDVVYYSSRTGKYLEAPPGLPSRQLLTMARRGLRLDLRAALRDAIETRALARRESVTVEGDEGRVQIVTITVEPLLDREEDEPLLLVLFQDMGPSLSREDAAGRSASRDGDGTIADLERDLRDTRERLQSMIEEYETALEELKSSNEELVSVNEELQSTNEELEASKEEMQSLNEELQTVNLELNGKLDDLDRVNADLHNLFQSTQIATVFLDRDLVIRSFTPTVSRFFAILDSDRGRPLTDLASRLDYPGLHRDVGRVVETGETREKRIERKGDSDGDTYYLVRLVPYRDADQAVAGVVVTFVDVSSLVRAEARQAALIDELNHRVKNMLTVVLGIANQTKRRTDTMDAFYDAFSGRLMAMARSNELLSKSKWADVGLEAIIGQELAPHGLDRMTAKGPAVRFPPKKALSLGMVLHELATNAAKYGALAEIGGGIALTWSITPGPAQQTLSFTWREHGGAPVVSPERKGFGLDLVGREVQSSLGGTLEVAFLPEGLRVDIALPFP